QQLAEQLVERQRRQRRVDDALDALQALGDRLGLEPRGLLADEELARPLRPLALAQVLHVDEQGRLGALRAGHGEREERGDRAARQSSMKTATLERRTIGS